MHTMLRSRDRGYLQVRGIQKSYVGQPCLITTVPLDPDAGSAGSPQSNESSSSEIVARMENHEAPALLRHAHDYGYSNLDSLSSMGMLTKVEFALDLLQA
jgi:hypothetical protein